MIKKRTTQIITSFMTVILLLLVILSLSACEKLEEREDYIEENGWMALITSYPFKTATLIGNKEQSVVNGEAIIPTSINGYKITHIRDINGLLSARYFDFIPNKLFIPGANYTFSNNIGFPYANKKLIFLSAEPDEYSNGYSLKHEIRYDVPYERSKIYYVPKAFINDFESAYDEYTSGEFKGANISYFYNYQNPPNGGYYWIDDLDEGESIKTIPSEPQRDGYKFGGWYIDEACITSFDFDAFTMQENGELELFAKWIQ